MHYSYLILMPFKKAHGIVFLPISQKCISLAFYDLERSKTEIKKKRKEDSRH